MSLRPRRKLVAVLVLAATLVLAASPARAHTSLDSSDPANLSRLSTPPETITLRFTDPVDPPSVTITVRDVEGHSYDGSSRRAADGEAASEVTFGLPELPDGTYGVAWQSIGPDGHRAAGEVVLGIGDIDREELSAAQFQALSGGDRMVDLAGGAGRIAWYLGLSFAVGALFSLWWLGSLEVWNASRRSLWKLSRRWLLFGQQVALTGFAVLSASRLAILGGSLEGDPGVAERLRYGAVSLSGLALATVLVALGWGLRTAKGVSRRPFASPRAERWRRIAAALVVAALGGSLGGHLAVELPLEIATVIRAGHLLGAAVWIGPLVIAALWLAKRSPESGTGERTELLKDYFARFAPVAGWALLVLIATGTEALWLNVGGDLLTTNYGVVLGIKVLLLLGGIVPLAWYHRRTVEREPTALVGKGFQKSLRAELAGLGAVLVLASALSMLNPSAGGAQSGRDPAGDLLSAEAVGDVRECEDLTIGQANCYAKYFSSVMRQQDAGAAVAEILELSQTNDYVASQCHQVAHDLGREAADYYDSLGEALAFEASACWSGYYHGVVEEELSGYDDQRLLETLPAVCREPAGEPYSFTHYNCVHGVGHGVMLRFDGDLFRSLDYCRAYTDAWELSSCAGGVFMQNIISAQEGTAATFREGDLVYPCNEVDADLSDECFTMQTSYILWKNGQDLAGAFAVCDSVDPAFAPDCYRSMGRDISGTALLDPATVVQGCSLGAEALREHCIVGASLNAVYNDHDPAKADELCALVDDRFRQACQDARDRAVGTF